MLECVNHTKIFKNNETGEKRKNMLEKDGEVRNKTV